MILPFSGSSKSKPISVTDTASASTSLPGIGDTVRLVNEGPNNCFVSIGTGSQTATLPNATPTATSTPVLAGSDISLTFPKDSASSPTALNISAICRSGGTALLVVQVGQGV